MAHRPPQTNVKLTKVKEYLDNNKINYAELGRRMGKERPLTEEFIMHLLCSKIK